jgi:hypothetical protein
MPVTVHPSLTAASPWKLRKTNTHNELLPESERRKSKSILASSISPATYAEKHITARNNGLVWAAYHAYSDHHHLVIRPEDVWFAIITQISFYVNAHAEELRSMFVSHEGRKDLLVETVGSTHTVDFGKIAEVLADMIQANVKTPDLQAWIIPSFTTTTEADRAVASVLMMGAMQSYFTYGARLLCGLPSATLLGEREDYENILQRLDTLPNFGKEPAAFAELLRPVIRSLIATFDPQPSAAIRDFWGRIAHQISGGSGSDYLSGWITAFCFWSAEGRLLGRSASSAKYPYGKIDFDEIPCGYASVPFKLEDNGTKYDTQLIAGSIGIQAFNQTEFQSSLSVATTGTDETVAAAAGDGAAGTSPVLDSCRPLTGWMLYHTNTPTDGHKDNELSETWHVPQHSVSKN